MRSQIPILFLLAWPACAQITGLHSPRISLGPAATQSGNVKVFESNNWSGYAVVGQEFTEARGSWRVPPVDCAASPYGSVSFWVGIDGWNDATVEQTGIEAGCNGQQPVYYAWYEFAPKAGVTITSVPVKPGDNISAAVEYGDAGFTVTLTNLTTGKSYSTSAAVPEARRNSAEWIVELNGAYGLTDFNAVRFGGDFTMAEGTNSATDATTSGPIGSFGDAVQASVIVNNQHEQAVPSFLSLDGTSFTVTWWSRN
jgi:hypothetical protein